MKYDNARCQWQKWMNACKIHVGMKLYPLCSRKNTKKKKCFIANLLVCGWNFIQLCDLRIWWCLSPMFYKVVSCVVSLVKWRRKLIRKYETQKWRETIFYDVSRAIIMSNHFRLCFIIWVFSGTLLICTNPSWYKMKNHLLPLFNVCHFIKTSNNLARISTHTQLICSTRSTHKMYASLVSICN